jgi:CCR4-NOT transcription complex subunit 7/8
MVHLATEEERIREVGTELPIQCNAPTIALQVWASTLEDEFKEICKIVQEYPFVAMDTEFPGVVARPIGEFKSTSDYQYQLLRCNVDLLKIIQLGLTFFNADGKMPEGVCTWQVNS